MECLTASLLIFFSAKLKAFSTGLRFRLRGDILNRAALILSRAVLAALEGHHLEQTHSMQGYNCF